MPRNGSGVYSVYTPGNPVVAGTTIDPTAFNNTTNDLATALTNSIATNGETTVTANLPMAGFKHTGAAAATATGQYQTYGQAGSFTDLTTTGNTILGDASTDTLNVGNGDLVKASGGNVGINSTTTPAYKLHVTAANVNTGIGLLSGGAGNFTGIGVGRTASDGFFAVAGAADNWFTGSASGDIVFRGETRAAWVGTASTFPLNLCTNGAIRYQVTSTGALTDALGNTVPSVVSKVKTAATSRNTTTTLADDPHLIATLSAGTWAVRLWIPVNIAASGGPNGWKLALAFTGTKSNDQMTILSPDYALSAMQQVAMSTGSSLASVASSSTSWLIVDGSLVVTVAGNLSLQWAQNSSGAQNLTFQQGAYMTCTKVG